VSPLNVYGFSAARPTGEPRGAVDEPVVAIDLDGLFALAGAVGDAPPMTADSIRSHEAAVRRLAGACDAFLPARFGSVVERLVLAGRRDELLEALSLVRGREQMTLRVYGTLPSVPASGGPGTRYLEERRRANALPELAPLRAALSDLVRAERLEPHAEPGLLASVYHLIDRGRSPEYLRAVEAVRIEPLRLSVSGPWPAWSFTPELLP
jgi:hypothetical protein